MVMEYGAHVTEAPMSAMTSANRTSPCKLSDPQPCTTNHVLLLNLESHLAKDGRSAF